MQDNADNIADNGIQESSNSLSWWKELDQEWQEAEIVLKSHHLEVSFRHVRQHESEDHLIQSQVVDKGEYSELVFVAFCFHMCFSKSSGYDNPYWI